MTIRSFLPPAAYRNYRNVRAAALMFIVLGSLLMLAGVAILGIEPRDDTPPPPKFLSLIFVPLGLAGVVGGIGVFTLNQRWAKAVYVMAALYVLAFPLGTILSIIMFVGLHRYFDDVTQFRRATSPPKLPPSPV